MKRANKSVKVTRDLLVRYDKPGPRYTSYPTAPEWQNSFGRSEYVEALADAASRPDQPLSAYIHIPFCQERCVFCACNTVVTKKAGIADEYLDYLDKELALVAELLGERRTLMQLHWGGGTPTYLTVPQIKRLMASIQAHFKLGEGAEVAIEIDPRVTSRDQVFTLRELGFNRVSMGVQDLNPKVQEAITRYQTEEETIDIYRACREAGFLGINFDLVYGLPYQCEETWEQTLKTVIELRPDRLAVYGYAHVPWIRPFQKQIPDDTIPVSAERYELFALARQMLMDAGYQAIGMDHFAVPEDELSHALDERKLHRNFMGYSVVPAAEMIGFGSSSIGEIGGCYAQNHVRLADYYDAIDRCELPTGRGFALSLDDRIRRWVIRRLMCDFYIDTGALLKEFGVGYSEYFAEEEKSLGEFYSEGLVARDGENLQVLPLGKVFIRNVAMVFDAYLRKPEGHRQFSRTV